jgi:superfamily II DNA or RNA helicase
MKFTLRPYQEDCLELLRNEVMQGRRPILCMPTGAGKTVTFSRLTELAHLRGSKVMVVCDRKELIDQAYKTMNSYGIDTTKVHYAMVQTLQRSPHKIPKNLDLVIIDECHKGNFRNLIEIMPGNPAIVGCTATPMSASNKKPLRESFHSVVCPVQIPELIEQGFLSVPEYHVWDIEEGDLVKAKTGEFTEESQARVFSEKDLLEAINKRIGKTMVFCSSIEQTLRVQKMITGSVAVHSKMSDQERDRVIALFKNYPDGVIVNCGILTTGFDDPEVETIILYRATTSLPLYLQMVGRGSRVIKNRKSKFYIYDLGGNVRRHQRWEKIRDWQQIFDTQGLRKIEKAAPLKKCVACEAVIYASAKECPYCGTLQPSKKVEAPKARLIKILNYEGLSEIQVDEKLAKLTKAQIARIVNRVRGTHNAQKILLEIAAAKNYKKGWAFYQLNPKT